MKINIQRLGQDFNLEARNEDGASVSMDSSSDTGGLGKGLRPMQLLLSALGGCSAMDVIGILKKQKQEIISFELEVNGQRERRGDCSLFKNIELHFKLKGNIDPGKVERAVSLSLDKYCSVAKTLKPTAQISYVISLNGSALTQHKNKPE